MTRPISSRTIVIRMVAGMLTIIVAAIVVLALLALSSCEGDGPQNCPPPIGCKK